MLAVMVLLTTNLLANNEVTVNGGESSAPDLQIDDNQLSLKAQRSAAHEHLTQLIGEQRYDEATAVALQILRLTQEEYGDTAQQVIEPLIELAETQQQGMDLSSAEQNLSTALMLIEKYEGPLSANLIRPLTMLGNIQNRSGQYKTATQTFDRALRLNHISHGFLNFDQFPIMDGLTDSHAALDNSKEARFYQESQLEIQQRKLGTDNPETAAAYYKLARWYSRNNRFDDAVLTYQRADRVVKTALGKRSPERAEALQGLAWEHQKTGNLAAASSTLRKALQLIEESAENDPLRRASVLVALGDNLTRSGKFNTAQNQYLTAWQALPDNDIGAERREFYFHSRVRIAGSLFPKYAHRARKRTADELKSGSILINYSVDAKGRVKHASVIEGNPQGLMDRTFLSLYRQSLFRPYLVEGTPEPRNGLLAEHEFFYIDDKNEDDSDAKPDKGKLSYPGKD